MPRRLGGKSAGVSAHAVHEILVDLPLEGIVRIDCGLEGDWSASVVPVWSRAEGRLSGGDPVREHATCRPSLELYFEGAWVGLHCFRRVEAGYALDEERLDAVIRWVESSLERETATP